MGFLKLWKGKCEMDVYVLYREYRDTYVFRSIHLTKPESIKLDINESYSRESIPFDAVEGDILHLVYVRYETGNSFGTDGIRTCIVDIFRNNANAKELCAKIKQEEARVGDFPEWDVEDGYTMKYKNEIGTEVKMYTPWRGYFERFINVDTQALVVKT